MSARYVVMLYHDEPEEASADVRSLEPTYRTRTTAVTAARRHLTDYWQTADITKGEWTPAVPGVCPAQFEADENDTPWRVGRDWLERS